LDKKERAIRSGSLRHNAIICPRLGRMRPELDDLCLIAIAEDLEFSGKDSAI
jgi:hypothetical protein